MKVKIIDLSNKQRIETLDTLYTAAAGVKGRDAMKLFLRDLLTTSERVMLGRRIIIARRFLANTPHREIERQLNVGRDTVRKVEKWLKDQLPSYEQAIKELEKELSERQRRYEDKKLYATSALYRLKKKYPLHFLLFPTPKLRNDI